MTSACLLDPCVLTAEILVIGMPLLEYALYSSARISKVVPLDIASYWSP